LEDRHQDLLEGMAVPDPVRVGGIFGLRRQIGAFDDRAEAGPEFLASDGDGEAAVLGFKDAVGDNCGKALPSGPG
jgi:hypothetical protein